MTNKTIKNFTVGLLSLCAASFFFTSCKDKGDDPKGGNQLSFDNISVDFQAQEKLVTFVATGDWSISSDKNWTALDKTEGKAGNVQFKLLITKNESLTAREAIITVQHNGQSSSFKVTQLANVKSIVSSKEEIFIGKDQNVGAVEITSNIKWSVESKPEWISKVDYVNEFPSDYVDGDVQKITIRLIFDESKAATTDLTGELKLKGSNDASVTCTIPVKKEAKPAYYISWDLTNNPDVRVSAAGASAEFTVTTNLVYNQDYQIHALKTEDGIKYDWGGKATITELPSTYAAFGQKKFKVTFPANDKPLERRVAIALIQVSRDENGQVIGTIDDVFPFYASGEKKGQLVEGQDEWTVNYVQAAAEAQGNSITSLDDSFDGTNVFSNIPVGGKEITFTLTTDKIGGDIMFKDDGGIFGDNGGTSGAPNVIKFPVRAEYGDCNGDWTIKVPANTGAARTITVAFHQTVRDDDYEVVEEKDILTFTIEQLGN